MGAGVIYQLHYVGGSKDGMEVLSPRPYDAMFEQTEIYVADSAGEDCLEWIDDDTRRITLRLYRSNCTEADWQKFLSQP